MSGIVAIFDRDGNSVDRDVFRAALSQIDHRGPDGRGAWRDGPVALGHQQLQSTPESQYDTQPYRDGDLVVTADARLDNRDELFDALEVSNRGEPVPDSHLMLEAYREWGTACADHLVGAFVFVVWDANARTVFCARDHVGVKPLYYHHSSDTFAVASEITSLLQLPSVGPTLDETRVGDFLVGRFGDKSNTFYEDVARLPPAHAAIVTADDTRTWRYWDLDPSRTVDLGSDAAYERRFRDLLFQAIECRLRTPDPVGVMLSGGLDSSSVTAVARALLPDSDQLHTFSWLFDDAPESDEREYVEKLTERSGITPHHVYMDDIGMLVDADDVYDGLAEPPHNPLHHGWWVSAKRAADLDVGILLDGAFGDTVINYGLNLLPHLLRTARWRRLWAEIENISERYEAPPRRVFVRLALRPLIPSPLRRLRRTWQGEPVLEQSRNPTLRQDFVDRTRFQDRYKRLYDDWSLLGKHPRQQQYEALQSGSSIAELEAMDAKYARFGLEPRHPFTDKRLVEFSLAMPVDQQLSDGQTRSIVRRAIKDLLPSKIRDRVWKTGLSEGFWNSLANDADTLRACVEDLGSVARYVDADELRSAHRRFESNEPTDSYDARALWRALSLWRWFQSREDPETAAPHSIDRQPD